MLEAEQKAKDKLICPNCNLELSYNGGTTNGLIDYRICWECKYEVKDIKYNVEVKANIEKL